MKYNDDKINQVLKIIERRKELANEGKGEMLYTEYVDIEKLIEDIGERLNKIEARLKNTPYYGTEIKL